MVHAQKLKKKKIVIYSQCDLFQTIINHPYMPSLSMNHPFKEGKNGVMLRP